ncbi:MAG: DUF3347 domain-containing protein [Flavitalea sp.]
MNKRVLVLFAVLIVVIFAFKFCNSKPGNKDTEAKPVPLAIGANSSSFNESFRWMLTTYFALKDAFITGDTTKVNSAAISLVTSADSLKVNELKGDTSGTITETAKSFATSISASSQAIINEKDIEAKRSEFNVITDALWSLTRTVKYDGQKIYYQYCPMALNNRGGYWLSDVREIKNPYFGSKMPTCGETADSLDYSKR